MYWNMLTGFWDILLANKQIEPGVHGWSSGKPLQHHQVWFPVGSMPNDVIGDVVGSVVELRWMVGKPTTPAACPCCSTNGSYTDWADWAGVQREPACEAHLRQVVRTGRRCHVRLQLYANTWVSKSQWWGLQINKHSKSKENLLFFQGALMVKTYTT